MSPTDDRFEGQILDEYDFVFKPKVRTGAGSESSGSGLALSSEQSPLEANRLDIAKRTARWNKIYGKNNYEKTPKLKRFCRKGVPKEHRLGCWLAVTGCDVSVASKRSVFQQAKNTPCRHDLHDVIQEDLLRTFPDNRKFQASDETDKLRSDLKELLEAFATYKPDPGYCQGMNSIAGMFLLLGAEVEQSFWLMDHITTTIVPPFYYSSDLRGLRVERLVFKALIQKYCPLQYTKIESFSGFELYFDKWFICLFIDCLPTEVALRVWDLLFYESFKNFHRAAIAIIHKLKNEILAAKDFMVLAELFSHLKENPKFYNSKEFVKCMFQVTSNLKGKELLRLRSEMEPVIEKENEETAERMRKRREQVAKEREKEEANKQQQLEKQHIERAQTSSSRMSSKVSPKPLPTFL